MRKPWEDELTRRTVLRLGLSGAALLALPWGTRERAFAQGVAPHFLVTFFADGGWDPTQVLDVHDPLDGTDGVDVDVPDPLLPASQIRTVNGLTYQSNATTRPSVDLFFNNWATRSAILNGINTRSTSHDQSRQLVQTGYLDPTKADFSVMAAHHNGSDMPLPHLLLSGQSFGGPFAGLSGRVGGQLSNVLAYNRIVSHSDPFASQQTVSALGEAYIQQALEKERLLDAPDSIAGRLENFRDASQRGDKLVRLASSLPQNFNNGTQLATALSNAFHAGMTTSVSLQVVGGFDTHDDNRNQNARWDQLFLFLNDLVTGLSTQPGVASPTLLDETTLVYCSEFGRTPQLNGNNGKDHHPWTSMLFVGKRVRPAASVGLTDSNQEGVKTNFSTGLADNAGQVIDVTNVVAGILTLVGANSNEYLPGVKPFAAMINA
jgi:uncharacterized protein (DUF1501 family)